MVINIAGLFSKVSDEVESLSIAPIVKTAMPVFLCGFQLLISKQAEAKKELTNNISI
jgi:hypothetical protein